jgi:hypothetical protein
MTIELRLRVDLLSRKRRKDLRLFIAESHAQGVAQRMSRVGGGNEDPVPAFGSGNRGGRSHGSFPYASLAGD